MNNIEWAPNVVVKVKGACWYVKDGTPYIPLLQPRKTALAEERLSLYCTLGRRAFCKGDWYNGQIELIDLSGQERAVTASLIYEIDLPTLSDARINQFVGTYLEAKAQVDVIRAARPKKPPKPKSPDLFDTP